MHSSIHKSLYCILSLSLLIVSWFAYTHLRAEPQNVITVYGNVDTKDVVVGFRVPGRVAKMMYTEGEQVSVGQIMAELDKDRFEAEYVAAEALLASAHVEYSNALVKYNRAKKLLETRNISQEEYDNASTQKDAKETGIKTAEAALKLAQINLDDTALKAPVNGIITSRIHEPGTIVSSGLPIYTIMPIIPVSIRTYVDEANLSRIHVGQTVKISTDGGYTCSGVIGFISPQAEFTPKSVETLQLRTDLVYRIKVIVEQPATHLHQGMPVTLQIGLEEFDGTNK
ncbi:efflux RND transporter periplasmic adaptor subunit [Rickettsiales endosymbiont of Peranema trichophorum]|uniref:efflux RND transporter periplasmic adaptor subunit n=1 Tax=Rickettsiales endosymbiont of Peranema trichophorum TaxID=2486577 RepID=UPI001A936A5B|nr:efflux RND transporter periplasmic adaptor subunit [Rickettsiales endosymbiont of Peranema trichophorum]